MYPIGYTGSIVSGNEHLKARAGMWQHPRWIEFVDALPKTATGRIQRYKLREQ